ncbi:hypothetical protein F3I16_15910 [Pseudomonas sp. L-22-4S-12]|uniref:hypothetical protein n=1 Tax=Pseudomonas sp. L-22-4S-12 TaxID=2610893 RepID=UPI0013286ED6|nr:hypothetical protein [Pseudomonas sp. L-22-4S-12]MWV17527.1 hypothetical protein [Pseudomonas sp. L-22-4S-12]
MPLIARYLDSKHGGDNPRPVIVGPRTICNAPQRWRIWFAVITKDGTAHPYDLVPRDERGRHVRMSYSQVKAATVTELDRVLKQHAGHVADYEWQIFALSKRELSRLNKP